jgi:hypothetical protein
MIRWEEQENGRFQGFSGELLVANVTKDLEADRERWLWKLRGLKRPKGWRKPTGHRTSWLEARRSAEVYWAKWLSAASLRPDIKQLALRSLARKSGLKHGEKCAAREVIQAFLHASFNKPPARAFNSCANQLSESGSAGLPYGSARCLPRTT